MADLTIADILKDVPAELHALAIGQAQALGVIDGAPGPLADRPDFLLGVSWHRARRLAEAARRRSE